MILETKRLILREFLISDANSMFELNNNSKVLKYTGDKAFISINEAEKFIEKYDAYQKNGFGRWAVLLKENNQFIGWCGLKLNEENFVDIGFRFFEKNWGQGYASEAAKATIEYGLNTLNIKEIIGRSSTENIASIKVLEKLNMKFWKYDDCKGIEDAVYYKITNS